MFKILLNKWQTVQTLIRLHSAASDLGLHCFGLSVPKLMVITVLSSFFVNILFVNYRENNDLMFGVKCLFADNPNEVLSHIFSEN